MSVVISLCIPVHNTEYVLPCALESIKNQQLGDSGLKQSQIEVVVINDCSTGTDSLGRNCAKIVKDFKKETSYKVHYSEHKKVTPLLETHREHIELTNGTYVMMVDSDDFLAPDCISVLYNLITTNNAEIAHGDNTEFTEENGEICFHEKRRTGKVYNGILEGSQIIESWLGDGVSSGFLWAKLVSRELYLDALDKLAVSDCSMITDFPLYFFVALLGKKYVGTDHIVYNYRTNSGVTSSPYVKDLDGWKRICSMVSGFTNVAGWIKNEIAETGKLPVSEKVMFGLRRVFMFQLNIEVKQLHKFVDPSIYDEAREMLCESWGKSFVEKVEKALGY